MTIVAAGAMTLLAAPEKKDAGAKFDPKDPDRIDVSSRFVFEKAESADKLPSGKWDYNYNFSYYSKGDGQNSIWEMQKFNVPAEWKNDRLRLYFATLQSDVIVFLNGKRVCEIPQPRGWADVTGVAREGENEL